MEGVCGGEEPGVGTKNDEILWGVGGFSCLWRVFKEFARENDDVTNR